MRRVWLLLCLAGCAAQPTPPVTRIVTVSPAIPVQLLHCAASPEIPGLAGVSVSQAMVAHYIVALWLAGEDCREHVAAIAQVAAAAP